MASRHFAGSDLQVAARALGIRPTVMQIARATGIDRDTISECLRGLRRPCRQTIRKLALGLRVPEEQARRMLTPEPETSPAGIVETPISNSPETLPSDLEASHEDHE